MEVTDSLPAGGQIGSRRVMTTVVIGDLEWRLIVRAVLMPPVKKRSSKTGRTAFGIFDSPVQ